MRYLDDLANLSIHQLRAHAVVAIGDFDHMGPPANDEQIVQRWAVAIYHSGGAEYNANELRAFIEQMKRLCPNPTTDVDGEPVEGCEGLIASKLRFELRENPEFCDDPIFASAVELGILSVEDINVD